MRTGVKIRATVLETGPAATQVLVAAARCAGCHHGCDSTRVISVPGVWHGAVDMVMEEQTKWRLAMHSLLLPLAGFVTGAAVSDYIGLAEAWSVTSAVAGLVLGVLVCRPHTFNKIHFTEAVEDE